MNNWYAIYLRVPITVKNQLSFLDNIRLFSREWTYEPNKMASVLYACTTSKKKARKFLEIRNPEYFHVEVFHGSPDSVCRRETAIERRIVKYTIKEKDKKYQLYLTASEKELLDFHIFIYYYYSTREDLKTLYTLPDPLIFTGLFSKIMEALGYSSVYFQYSNTDPIRTSLYLDALSMYEEAEGCLSESGKWEGKIVLDPISAFYEIYQLLLR